MSSFFLKNSKKRKSIDTKENKYKKLSKKKTENDEIDSDEAINSDNEETDNEEYNFYNNIPKSEETAQEKRLRLAKQYLEEIEKEEQIRADDKGIDDHISKRLQTDYLESVGKLRKNVAENYKGYKSTIKFLKHKLQKLPFTYVVISSDGEFLLTGNKSEFILKWDLKNFTLLGSINCLNVNENELFNKEKNKKRRLQILSMCLSSDIKFLAIADGGNDIQIWDPKELKFLKILKGHRDVVTCLVIRKDTHQLFSGSKDRSVKIWSLDEMSYIESLFGHQSAITGIDALYRERAITSGGMDCSVRIWKIAEESQLIYNGHRGRIEDVKLINNENFLSSGDDGCLCIWSTLKKKPLCTYPLAHGKQSNGEANWICAIATLINTDLIASGSCDGFIRIWKMCENGRRLIELFSIPVKGFVNSLAFSPDGLKIVAAVSQEHRLGRWWRIKEAKNYVAVIEFEKLNFLS